MRFDDAWFHRSRGRLLQIQMAGPRADHFPALLREARLLGLTATDTDGAFRHLAPRHAAITRAALPFFRAALLTCGVPTSDALVNAAAQVEWLWYVTPFHKFYRDHLAHTLKVALLGEDLATHPDSPLPGWMGRTCQGLAGGSVGAHIRRFARRLGVPEESVRDQAFWSAALLHALRIASLLHDITYPDTLAEKVVLAATPARPRNPFEQGLPDTARHACAWLEGRLCVGSLTGQALVDAWYSHGPRSAYTLLRLGDAADLRHRREPAEVLAFEWAAHAVFLHDLDGLWPVPGKAGAALREHLEKEPESLRPSWCRDPLAWLLALSDQLQDFGRMHYEPVPGDADSARLRLDIPCRAVEVEAPAPGHLQVVFRFEPDAVDDQRRRKTPGGRCRELQDWMDSDGILQGIEVRVEQA